MLSTLLFSVTLTLAPVHGNDDLLTVAEKSGYTETATYAEVMTLATAIADSADHINLIEMGTTLEGRAIPILLLANPPITTAEEARESGKLLIFAFANIHAGEVCGKEAFLMFARELAAQPDHPFFNDLIIALAPIYNADGNERFSPDNRPGQVGPRTMGQRPNAQGLDLNRDYIKLESPEARAMVRFLTEWDPHLIFDSHTTNGSAHRYTITYAEPTNPAGFTPSIEFIRDGLLPTVTERLRSRTGYDMFFYGNFNRDQTIWATYSHEPRFGGPYHGLRGQMSILSEAYSYAPYQDRILATREFLRETLTYAQETQADILQLHQQAKDDTINKGRDPQPFDTVGIRYRPAAFNQPTTIKGYEMQPTERGRPVATDTPKDYPVIFIGRFEPTLSVRRPFAYLIPPGNDDIIEKLHQHGVETQPFQGDATVEQYTIQSIEKARRPFQGHLLTSVEAHASLATQHFPAGSTLIPLAQPLGNLIIYLLEPMSDDGFTTWELFGDRLKVGQPYPIVRIAREHDLH